MNRNDVVTSHRDGHVGRAKRSAVRWVEQANEKKDLVNDLSVKRALLNEANAKPDPDGAAVAV
jgi:hypothetical protein